MKKEAVRACIEEIGLVPSVRVNSREMAQFAAETVYSSGIPVVEITLTTPHALDVVNQLASRHSDLAIGVGTILDEETARRAIDAGARFLTSPGFVPEVVAFARSANVVVFPGALTPTEVIAAWKAGADFVKLFPIASVNGPSYVRALRVPLPQIPLIITGGVNPARATEYIAAGAVAVGVGSELLPAAALETRQQDWIRELARRFIATVKEGRKLQDEIAPRSFGS